MTIVIDFDTTVFVTYHVDGDGLLPPFFDDVSRTFTGANLVDGGLAGALLFLDAFSYLAFYGDTGLDNTSDEMTMRDIAEVWCNDIAPPICVAVACVVACVDAAFDAMLTEHIPLVPEYAPYHDRNQLVLEAI